MPPDPPSLGTVPRAGISPLYAKSYINPWPWLLVMLLCYIPYGGYFSCGANFRYFRGWFGSHENQCLQATVYTRGMAKNIVEVRPTFFRVSKKQSPADGIFVRNIVLCHAISPREVAWWQLLLLKEIERGWERVSIISSFAQRLIRGLHGLLSRNLPQN
jgi:hypothetical protein